jgi:hypothetical protein
MKYSVPKIWSPDDVCIILAGGPSLRDQNHYPILNLAQHLRIITINDSWRLVPFGEIHYFCDEKWWSDQIARNYRALNVNYSFHDSIYLQTWIGSHDSFIDHPQVRHLNLTGQQGLETDPTGLRHGSNSGYQAINLAYHYGAKKIILLGYDMHVAANGRTHWHDAPRQAPNAFADILKQTMLPHFQTLVEPLEDEGVQVINATPDSELKCFPMMSLEDVIKEFQKDTNVRS